MAINTVPIREARHKLLEDGRVVLNKAETEKRTMTAEEMTEYRRLRDAAEAKSSEIKEAELRNDQERLEAEETIRQKDEAEKRAKTEKQETTTAGRAMDSPEYRKAFTSYLLGSPTQDEYRVLSAGTGTAGGYLYAPETFVNELIQNVTDATIFRGMARVLPPIIGSDSLGAPTLTNRMAAAAWTSELGAPSRDSTLAFGKRALTPHPLAKEIVVSKVLLRKVPSAEALVRGELSRVVSEAMENAYMTGTGVQSPLGIFTASNDGISTDRDVAGNTTTAVTADGLKKAKYTLKQAYWARAQWLMHRECMEQIAGFKDGNGRYMFQDSIVQGEPDRLLGFPVRLSEYAPHVFTSALYVAMLGDFSSAYWIVDSIDMQIQRLEELYARNNEDLFIIRMMTDGAPVLEEAVVRVKLSV